MKKTPLIIEKSILEINKLLEIRKNQIKEKESRLKDKYLYLSKETDYVKKRVDEMHKGKYCSGEDKARKIISIEIIQLLGNYKENKDLELIKKRCLEEFYGGM
jgi:hypothetical protein